MQVCTFFILVSPWVWTLVHELISRHLYSLSHLVSLQSSCVQNSFMCAEIYKYFLERCFLFACLFMLFWVFCLFVFVCLFVGFLCIALAVLEFRYPPVSGPASGMLRGIKGVYQHCPAFPRVLLFLSPIPPSFPYYWYLKLWLTNIQTLLLTRKSI